MGLGGRPITARNAFETYFSRMRETWEEWRIEDADVFEADEEHLVSVFSVVGRGKASGALVEQPVGITYRFRDGKLWRIRSYLDPRGAARPCRRTPLCRPCAR